MDRATTETPFEKLWMNSSSSERPVKVRTRLPSGFRGPYEKSVSRGISSAIRDIFKRASVRPGTLAGHSSCFVSEAQIMPRSLIVASASTFEGDRMEVALKANSWAADKRPERSAIPFSRENEQAKKASQFSGSTLAV